MDMVRPFLQPASKDGIFGYEKNFFVFGVEGTIYYCIRISFDVFVVGRVFDESLVDGLGFKLIHAHDHTSLLLLGFA